MKRDISDYPAITKRIMSLINEIYGGNVNKFCQALGLTNSVKVNRLFKRDTRNNEYPTPSTDIILLISNKMNVSADWLLNGSRTDGEMDTSSLMNDGADKLQSILDLLLIQGKQIDLLIKGFDDLMKIIQTNFCK